jgi:hypothetical protein
MIYYLNFFDQFSRSHSLWSPDGRFVVYAALTDDGKPEVRLAEVGNPGVARTVGAGTIGVWSW